MKYFTRNLRVQISKSNKFLLLVIFALLINYACSMGSKSHKDYPIVSNGKNAWISCSRLSEEMLVKFNIENPEKKLCSSYCQKGKLDKDGCPKKNIVIEYKELEKEYQFFKPYVCVPEYQVF